MADLRERFARLDAVPAPDLWAVASGRAAAHAHGVATVAVERGRWSAESRPRGRLRPLIMGLPAYAVLGLLLVAALIGSLLVAGGYVHVPRLGLGLGPTGPAPTASEPTYAATRPPILGASAGSIPACPGSTGLGDIVDTTAGHRIPSWQSGDVNAGGEAPSIAGNPAADGTDLAVVGRDTDGRANAVYLLDVRRQAACVLAELPSDFSTKQLRWSRAGDALAISGTTRTNGEIFVWSSIGMSQVWIGGTTPQIDWEPNDADLLVVGGNAVLVSAYGTTMAFDPICPAACGPISRGLWSPDGRRVAFDETPANGGAPDAVIVMETSGQHAIRYPQSGATILGWNDDRSLNLFARDAAGGHVIQETLPAPLLTTTRRGTFPTDTPNALDAAGTLSAYVEPGSAELTVQTDQDTRAVIALRGSAVGAFQWSPSGTQLAFETTTSGVTAIWIYRLRDPSVNEVGAPGNWSLLDFRDGDGVAVGSWRPAVPAR